MSFLSVFSEVKRKDLDEALAKISKLEHDFKMLSLEWSESYDKIRHALDRLKKRQLAATAEQSSTEDASVSTAENPEEFTHAALWRVARQKGMVR